MNYNSLCQDLLGDVDTGLSSIFEQLENHTQIQKSSPKEVIFNPLFNRTITSIDYVGQIKRTVPYSEDALNSVPVKALKRNMDEMGITEIMPTYYANRMKRFAEMGFVEAGGHSFTPKGQSHSTAYLEQQGVDPKTAIKRAQSAQSLQISEERGIIAASPFTRRNLRGEVSSINIGYEVDDKGLAQKKQ